MNLYNDASLAMIPSAVKDGKLYSIRPTDGSGDFTFSRGSNLAATRVDENGLIEKGRENLLLQSNQFDTTWASSVTLTSGQNGYDGSNDAWLLTKTASGPQSVYAYVNETGIMTMSVYAKANSANWLRLTQGGKTAYFDLQNGVVGSTSDGIDQTITSVGNGWYRCTLTANKTIAGQIPIYPYTAEGDASGSTDSIYIQDAQLEYGLVDTDYIETTTTTAQAGILEDMPRLDYSGGASCPSLLLEPQRQNLMPQSEPFSGGDWLLFDNATITTNFGTSPEGVQNAAKISSAGGGNDFIYDILSVTNGTKYTTSCFVKNIDSARTYIYGVSATDFKINWNGSVIDSVIGTNVSYEDYGNGWYRVSQVSISNTTSNIMRFYPDDASVGGGSVLLYGYQVESNASYPSSYIPTYGSAVTRSIDICIKTSATSLIGQTQGTFFIEFVPLTLDDKDIFYFNQSTASSVHLRGSNSINVRIRIGSFSFQVNGGSISVGQTYKVAVVYDESFGLKLFVNGVKYENNTPFTFATALDTIVINSTAFWTGDGAIENKQLLVFKTALTDSEAIALTQ